MAALWFGGDAEEYLSIGALQLNGMRLTLIPFHCDIGTRDSLTKRFHINYAMTGRKGMLQSFARLGLRAIG
ncbi:hypothetical protein L8N14_006980 [Serratia marcescens]|uniref:hypothetical protein n=1 Tax=Serratia marcescens TaxID=615 RepID=UPI001C94B412|nr:hypothetical protein [Serratia marcescens]MBY4847805.1 hypothetical protein [Serratia marcescens]MCH9865811.1 hypothetical protein [Serratia marcescens]